jgi:hypothetical protein|tara:strand:- start:37749 stop:38021 length:273 start_codon:yes stop_codon:yes gene_type:complete
MSDEQQEKLLTTEEHIENFIADLEATEKAMEPFKEHKRDLRASYVQNKWLTREEIWTAIKAYRLLKNNNNVDISEIQKVYKQLEKKYPRS